MALSLCAVLTVSSCSSAGAPTLVHAAGGDHQSPDEPDGGGTIPSKLRQPESVQVAVYVCSVRDVPVDVTLLNPDGMRLITWGINNGGVDRIGETTRWAQAGDYKSHRVRVRCKSGNFAKVGVDLERTSVETADTQGFELRYRSGDEHKSLTLAFSVALCGKDPQPVPDDLDGDLSVHEQAVQDCSTKG